MQIRSIRPSAAFVVALAAASLAGCASGHDAHDTSHMSGVATMAAAATAPAPTHATAHVVSTKGNIAHGVIDFEDVAGGVRITAVIEGLSPSGVHAIHLHEFGDISATDGMSAGGHYNPEGHQHGGPDAPQHHAGDFGNLHADAAGRATLDFIAQGLTVAGAVNPVIGRSVVIHAKADDLVTQPTGGAGGRIACGIVGVTKPAAPK